MKKITLDKRLLAIAAYVEKNAVVADVGCDHGYLAAYLVLNGQVQHVYASDVNPKPLAKAEALVEQYGLRKQITTILSDGLDSIPHEVDTIIMAGMGGELIASLLSASKWVKAQGRRFIFQPMTFAEKLRKYLAENGFEVIAETPVLEEKHTYCIINSKYTGNRHKISELQSITGKIDTGTVEGREYIKRLYQKYSHVLEGIKKSKNKDNLFEISQLVEELGKCLE